MRALLEVVILPVSDPDVSLHFYRDLVGFELDVDYAPAPDFRVVQLTPKGSSTLIQFGVGMQDPDPDPDHARSDYASFADFSDPDGNGWVLQERGHGLKLRRGGVEDHALPRC